MDLKVLRKLNMRRRISCSRAASKYCWGVKYGMAFFWGRRYGGWWVGVKPKTGGFVFGGSGDRCYSGYGLGGMKEIKKSGGGDVRAEALAWDDEWDKA